MASGAPTIDLEDLPPALQELLRGRVERLGYLGEFFQRCAAQPEALVHFVHWTESLKTAVPFRLVEIIALSIAAQTKNDYERVQHENLALRNGFSEVEVRCLVERRVASAESLTTAEVAAANLALCMSDNHGNGCRPAFSRLTGLVGEEVAVGCLMTVARYIGHAAMANVWELKAPTTSLLGSEQALDSEQAHG